MSRALRKTAEPQAVADSPQHSDGNSRKALTRRELARALSERCADLSLLEAAQMLETIIEEMTAALVEDGTLKLKGFGTFVVHEKGERLGRNPKTGETATIAPRKVVGFKPYDAIKTALNG
jgi:integration host factor subunit alpha